VSTPETIVQLTDINLSLPNTGRERTLLVIDEGHTKTYPLPMSGSVVVGRGADSDVVIDESSVSRNHVRLDLGEDMYVTDLGSTHGTLVAGKRLSIGDAVSLRIGESFDVGRATLMVKARGKVLTEAEPADATEARDPMQEAQAMVRKVALGRISVLIVGETGVGKEMTAEMVHRCSPRSKGSYIRINCGALTESLLASELFGHEKGAFTGATATKLGLLEAASGGSIFLDEIGELSLALQVSLLRALEEGTVRRVGGVKDVPIDLRFIAATNRDLGAEVAAGRFREDLYYRLAGVTVEIPPLRDRPKEVAPLAGLFAERAAADLGVETPNFSEAASAALRAHDWPGNVRQLRNVVERAVLLADGNTIDAKHLKLSQKAPSAVAPQVAPTADATDPPASELPSMQEAVRGEVEVIERQRIVAALEHCAGNQTRAAKHLNMSRRAFVNRLDAYGIPRPRKGKKLQ